MGASDPCSQEAINAAAAQFCAGQTGMAYGRCMNARVEQASAGCSSSKTTLIIGGVVVAAVASYFLLKK